jgi:hypothetical protein
MTMNRQCLHGVDVGPLDDYGATDEEPVSSSYCNDCNPRLVKMDNGTWTHSIEWQYLTHEEQDFLSVANSPENNS